MKLYFSYSRVPEMAELNRAQRKAVLRCALEAYLQDEPSRVWLGAPWMFGGLLGGALAGWMAVLACGLAHSQLLIVLAGGLAGAALGTFIATLLNIAQLRPYLRRVREERKDEIAQMGSY